MTDQDAIRIIKDIDSLDDIEVSDFEAEFIESNLGREFFTSKQKEVLDRMNRKYLM